MITISNLDNSFHTFIYSISFTTPLDRRAALVEQAKALYSNDTSFKCGDFVGAPGADNLDRINRIDRINASDPVNPVNPVQTAASLSAALDSRKILEFVGACLSAVPEESDVVHDLLACLAQRMIEMNKEKNAERKGFLRWLEGEIGAPVEELTNKTAIKEYYEAGFDGLAGLLAPLLKRIEATDGLIDQVVYKLYGLTPEEIAIVEISNKGKQQ